MTNASRAWPRSRRLTQRADFLTCYEMGEKFYSSHFIVHVARVSDSPPRAGITVSRKVGGAVARNRVKRLLREFFRLNMSILPNANIVAVARKNADRLNLASVTAELAPIFQRFKLRGQ